MDQPVPSGNLGTAAVIAAVGQLVSYLRAETEAPAGDGWLRSDVLCRGGDRLVELIAATGRGRGTEAPDVAASLFAQAYTFRIGAIPLAAHALGLPVPDARPAVTAISIDRYRPSSVALLSPVTEVRSDAELAHMLLAEHCAPFFDAVRGELSIGERLLWGNAASSFARVFRAIEGADGVDRTDVRRRAEGFFAAAQPWFHGLGRFDTVTVGSRDGWFWTRTSCCLWYQAAGGSMFDDCSLVDADELRVARTTEVAG
jgi:hypothetical protein